MMLNIRWDDYPEESNVSTTLVFAQEPPTDTTTATSSVTTSIAKRLSEMGTKPGQVQSYPVDDFSHVNALYLVQVTDNSGDGICCEFGNGW